MIKVIAKLGDTCAEDHGAAAVVRNDDGYIYLEWTHGLESEHPGEDRYGDEVADLKLEVFRVQLDEPAWVALSGCGDEIKLWTGIASSVGMDADDVIELAKSDRPLHIAGAFEMFAGHWGWRELDSYPMSLRYADVEERWAEPVKEAPECHITKDGKHVLDPDGPLGPECGYCGMGMA